MEEDAVGSERAAGLGERQDLWPVVAEGEEPQLSGQQVCVTGEQSSEAQTPSWRPQAEVTKGRRKALGARAVPDIQPPVGGQKRGHLRARGPEARGAGEDRALPVRVHVCAESPPPV